LDTTELELQAAIGQAIAIVEKQSAAEKQSGPG
jgi:hypothetical protein